MKCEYCMQEHDGLYGSGRFCNKKCARGFSTKAKRKLINKIVSEKLKQYPNKVLSKHGFKKGYDSRRFLITSEFAIQINKKRGLDRKVFASQLDFIHLNLGEKKERVLKEQDFSCNKCKINSWENEKIVLEFHHKDGNHSNNSRNNVEYLCPNCHSQTDTYRVKINIRKRGV